MNFWKPIALCSIAALGLTIAPQLASAGEAKGEGTVVSSDRWDGACRNQPHMASAINKMRDARGDLGQAEHNKAGFRVQVMGELERIMDETKQGCADADHDHH